jgi:hypothetical protein
MGHVVQSIDTVYINPVIYRGREIRRRRGGAQHFKTLINLFDFILIFYFVDKINYL